MEEKNEIKINNNNSQIGEDKKKFVITTLPPDFYRKVIELENKIQLSQPSMDEIKELGSLYKKAIEFCCTTSPKKVRFFSEKLTKLLIGVNKLAKNKNKKSSKWSIYMNSHRKNYNKFMLFLEIEGSNKEAELILKERNEKFGNIILDYYNNLDSQKNNFKEKMRLKLEKQSKNENNNEGQALQKMNDDKENINSINVNNMYDNYNMLYNKLKGRNDLVDISLKNFFKKFHYIYINSKIFNEPIESFNYILDDMFCHKVTKYFYYQEQIKEFQMILDDKNQNNNEESLAFFLNDLTSERKQYYQNLEEFIEKKMKKIQDRCAEAKINKDKNLEKYILEFMEEISKIFC